QANIIGTYNIFEAARRNGVKRIVFPTSNHAVGFYRRDQTIDHRVYPKPDGRYGVSKVFGEALGSLYADKYGMEMYMIRIGNVNPKPIDKRRLSIWISPRDNSNAYRLGYQPQDDAEAWADEVLRNEKPGADPIAELYQGGIFCAVEEVP